MTGSELTHITRAVELGNITGDGHFTAECSRLLESRYDIARVLLTPSCTAALEISAMLLNLRSGDEVILPSYTFVSTANAFVRLGARPVFVDIREDTLNIDETKIEAAITERTKMICAVHYAGVACEMDSIMRIADDHGISVLEDAAQGVHAEYRGRALGSIAPLGAYSFHATKNYTCGEGGALCINDPELIDRAEIIREKGTNRNQFLRGDVDKYTWVDVGSSYVPSEISSAFLFGQLEHLDAIAERRKEIYERYESLLQPVADNGHFSLPCIPADCRSNYHMFYIVLKDQSVRDQLIDNLRQNGISAVFHYIPLHSSLMGESFGYQHGDLPITESVSTRLVRLPFYFELSTDDQQYCCEKISEFFKR
ncbi:MAG: dTDP-4-amino-4,6-dideoxygalactose transaminase [Planctomycetaceae bacterium]|nr:dTDP-4-amino-4,6-dideoxygalactose transaminase [Planctomycetaceae bacterium]